MKLLPGTSVSRALLLGFVALAARLLYIAVAGRDFDVTSPGDHMAYTRFARVMMSGLASLSYPLADREPLYSAFMAMAYSLPGGDFGALQVLQAVLGALATSVAYLGLRAFVGERVAILASAMFALHPHFVPLTALPLRENLLIPLVVGFTVSFLAAMKKGSLTRLFVHALFIMLLVHTDVRFLPLVVAFPFMALASHRGLALAGRQSARVALFSLLLLIPYQARCYVVMGHPVIVTERFLGRWLPRAGLVTGPSEKSTVAREEWLAEWETRKAASIDTLSARERAYFASGGRPLLGHTQVHWFLFKDYWRFARTGPVYRPYPSGRFEPGWSRVHNVASSLVMVPFLVLLPVFFVLAPPAARRVVIPLLVYMLAHCLLHVLVHAIERYRIPLEVVTGLLVATSVVLLWDRLATAMHNRMGDSPQRIDRQERGAGGG